MMGKCNGCDPEYFILYGYCFRCGRKGNKPLFDPFDSRSKLWEDKEWEIMPENIKSCREINDND